MSNPSKSLDVRVIIETALRQFVPWLAMVALVSLAGYPGVICVTPMAWLIALRVGNLCVAHSTSQNSSQRLWEAALAGGLLGLLQGILFLVFLLFLGPIEASEWTRAILLVLIQLILGILAGAGLSFFTAYLTEQRLRTP
ncbi:MAG TPA: hypothetical protein VIR02_07125 [Anaerolineales bacterium]